MKFELSNHRFLCLWPVEESLKPFESALTESKCQFFFHHDTAASKEQVYNDPPDMILVSDRIAKHESFIENLKNDALFSHIPIILIMSQNNFSYLEDQEIYVDDWLFESDRPEELLIRIRMRCLKGNKLLDANPLTRLPGNFSIMNQLSLRLEGIETTKVGIGYVDIDNFKAFNDRYGFARGDEMIRMTARILTNVVKRHDTREGFVGHIGGDDFVFFVSSKNLKNVCVQVLQYFDMVSATLLNEEDRMRGFFESEDRQGNHQVFPLPSLSIAGIDSSKTKIKHPGEASALASELKKYVKKLKGSNFVINRRK